MKYWWNDKYKIKWRNSPKSQPECNIVHHIDLEINPYSRGKKLVNYFLLSIESIYTKV